MEDRLLAELCSQLDLLHLDPDHELICVCESTMSLGCGENFPIHHHAPHLPQGGFFACGADLLQQPCPLSDAVCATDPTSLDPLLRRPGRVDLEYALHVPSMEERRHMLLTLLQKV